MPAHPTVSAVWPLNVAIAAAIDAAIVAGVDALGTGIDGGIVGPNNPRALDDPPVYSGQVPENVEIVSAYIVLASSAQMKGRGTFRRRGLENVETVDVWTADQSKYTAGRIADALVRLLNGVPLALAGYGSVRGDCEIVLTVADPSTRNYRAQLRYTARSISPAP